MRIEIIGDTTHIDADEGKFITNGLVYGTWAEFKMNDSVDNWHDIDSVPEPKPDNGFGG